jgi:hypothetical protein
VKVIESLLFILMCELATSVGGGGAASVIVKARSGYMGIMHDGMTRRTVGI